MSVLPASAQRTMLTLGLTAAFGFCLAAVFPSGVVAQDYIPATRAFDAPGCSTSDLSNDIDLARSNPEWKAINPLDSFDHPFPQDQPTILEGWVLNPPPLHSWDQSSNEVAEEDIPWNHYTHDYTFKVVPDPNYQYLLSSWLRDPGVIAPDINSPAACASLGWTWVQSTCYSKAPEICPDGTLTTTCHHTDMEVEWENGSVMKVNDDDNRFWGAAPEFVWPAIGDRVWVEGRWIFDCGHPSSDDMEHVKFSTEIHPPRALVTLRLNHTALAASPSASLFPASWLPVTGEPIINPIDGTPIGDPTRVPVTEADIFVSGNGGGANDICSLIPAPPGALLAPCLTHTGPVIPVNDRNYVFDIYPPGTDYTTVTSNGNFTVTLPVPDAFLQWRMVDRSDQLPAHTCGIDPCVSSESPVPNFCPIDDSTPPPPQDQSATPSYCPDPPQHPTRLRVILPFHTRGAHYLAKSILLGWDDVPAPPATPAVRTFRVTMHAFSVLKNGETFPLHGDWRVLAGVGGEWRYVSGLTPADSTSDCNHHGLVTENSLTGNSDEDCYRFDGSPWIVSVQQGQPIHISVGGFESDDVDSDFCRNYTGCDFDFESYVTLGRANDDRVGTYEFDLQPPASLDDYVSGYTPPLPFVTQNTGDGCRLPPPLTCDELQYGVEFRAREIAAPIVDPSFPLGVGDPHFALGPHLGNYISSTTPITLTAAHRDYQGFQYRFKRQGYLPPTYYVTGPPELMAVHWTSVNLPVSSQSVSVYLNFNSPSDGRYELQYSEETGGHELEPRHYDVFTLDNTPPIATITQPIATTYVHSTTLMLNYSVDDGSGSGVQSVVPTMDGKLTLADGTGLSSGQTINLLTELILGSHTLSIRSTDNVSNSGVTAMTFSIIVTPDSIKDDVRQFLQNGAIKRPALAILLLATLNAAARQQQNGHCAAARALYNAFIHELQAQSGRAVDAAAVAIMIGDAQYLIAHCP